MTRQLSRWRWPLAALAVCVGLLVGLLVALVSPTDQRAEAAVVVSAKGGVAAVRPLLPNLRELATSSVLAGNVRSTLRLRESEERVRRRFDASIRPGSEVIVIRATAPTADRARQLAQEAGTVFTQLVAARFGPNVEAKLFDAAHVTSRGSRHVGRDLLYGGVLGLCAGLLAASVLGNSAPVLVPAGEGDAERKLREREQLLEQRTTAIGERERAVARRVGELAAREEALAVREQPSTPSVQTAPAPPSPGAPAGPAPSGPPPPAAPAPDEAAAPSAASDLPLNVEELTRLVDGASAPPERLDEWRTYLFFLREHAAADGALPESLQGLVDEVFSELPLRTR